MKSYDYEAVAYDGDVYCLGCLPKGVDEKDADPIFADSEWDYYPVCCVCRGVHDYVNLTSYGRKELQRQRERQTYGMGDISPRFGEFLTNPGENKAATEATNLLFKAKELLLEMFDIKDYQSLRNKRREVDSLILQVNRLMPFFNPQQYNILQKLYSWVTTHPFLNAFTESNPRRPAPRESELQGQSIMGPEPDDYVKQPSGRLGSRTSVGQPEGRFVGEFDDDDAADRAIRDDMERYQFFPTVWIMSDHGNLCIDTDFYVRTKPKMRAEYNRHPRGSHQILSCPKCGRGISLSGGMRGLRNIYCSTCNEWWPINVLYTNEDNPYYEDNASKQLAIMPSMSDPNKKYAVMQDDYGHYWCTCPAWKYQRLPPAQRTCKHINSYLQKQQFLMEQKRRTAPTHTYTYVQEAEEEVQPVVTTRWQRLHIDNPGYPLEGYATSALNSSYFSIGNVPAYAAERYIGTKLLHSNDRQNESPTVRRMLDMVKRYDGNLFGYVIPVESGRPDARISFDGFIINVDEQTANRLKNTLHPDEFSREPSGWRFWWD
jgi:hypothetical protein